MANYIVNFTNVNVTPITILEGEANVTSTDIALFGRARLEYGEQLNETLLHLLENFACVEDNDNPGNPDLSRTHQELLSNPTVGQFWHNISEGLIYYWDGLWVPLSRADDIAALYGTILHGEQIPLPVSSVTGHAFTYAECVWSVSPYSYDNVISDMVCATDADANVTMTYTIDGGGTTQGVANYLIIGIRGNSGYGEQVPPPQPSPTPTPDVTPSPTATDGTIPTPTPTPSPTVSLLPSGQGDVFQLSLFHDVQDVDSHIYLRSSGAWDQPYPDIDNGLWVDMGYRPGESGVDYTWTISNVVHPSGASLHYSSGADVANGHTGNFVTTLGFLLHKPPPPTLFPSRTYIGSCDVTIVGPTNTDVISVTLKSTSYF